MELAIKIVLLGACLFTSIYIIAKLSDKMQKKDSTKDLETTENKDSEKPTEEK